MKLPLRNRTEAARELARTLRPYTGRKDVVVLGLPRGGVPVAFEIARSLGAPLDVILVRKLGQPFHRELAMGAIATGGVKIMNPEVAATVEEEVIEAVAREEEEELRRRERVYRGDRPFPDLGGKCVILADDGLATGATMRAAVAAVRQLGAARIVVAAPIGPAETIERLREEADEVVVLDAPEPFFAISPWYEEFEQVSDDEVRALLEEERRRP